MAAYSYQPHHFLLNSIFLPNTTPLDIPAFGSEGNFTSTKNSTTAAFGNNMISSSELEAHHDGFSDAAGFHDHSSKMHSAASSINMEKVEEMDERVSQKLINCSSDKEDKTRKGSSLNSTPSKRRKLQGKAKKKEKKGINGQNVEEKTPKANKNNKPKQCSDDQDNRKDYIHVRARRGQATDSHSLAERVRRERISERMKMLQDLVPGCEKVTGKALVLDEIINYVQSLQNQIEFLSMKLASFNPIYSNFAMDLDATILKQERLSSSGPSGSSQLCSPTAVNYNSSTTTFSWQQKNLLRLRDLAKLCVSFDNEGAAQWRGTNNQFSTKGTYDLLNDQVPKVPWADLVWAKLASPKHSFITWLAIRNRLKTKDRMQWKEMEDFHCCWCKSVPESNDHIFFNCHSMQVLRPLLAAVGTAFDGSSWQELLHWRNSKPWKCEAEKEVTSYLINVSIYEIWRNRNDTIFNNKSLDAVTIRKGIWRSLNIKIHSCDSTKGAVKNLKDLNFQRNIE